MTSQKEIKGRILGATEGFFAYLTEKFGTTIVFQIGLVEISNNLSFHIQEAGRILASHQESLRVTITKTDQIPGFKFVPCENWKDIDVKFLTIDSKEDWVKVLYNEMNSIHRFPHGPLWGIVVAKVVKTSLPLNHHLKHQYIIILKFHHAISDGKSAFDVLYRQYLPILSALLNDGNPDEVIANELPLQTSVEDLLLKSATPIKKTNNDKPQILEPILFKDTWKTSEESSHTGIYPVMFSKQLTTGIIKAAKQNHVSVHSVLTGVASVALCSTSSEAGIHLGQNIKQMWSIDVRKFTEIKSPEPLFACVGNGFSTTKNKFDYSNEEFWQMCYSIYESIKIQNTEPQAKFAAQSMEQTINECNNDWDMFLENCMGFDNVAIISNLGKCNSGPEPIFTKGEVELKLQEAYFAIAGPREADTYTFAYTILTFNGKIMMLIQCHPKVVSQKFATNLRQNFLEMANKYCN